MDKNQNTSQEVEVRKGPWTLEEDMILINYISNHGEGVWNSLARSAGLKRTGKSCRLRWLNYLKPDVRRGNITPEEELLIIELHEKWGNRWSKIAKQLPGRTDNEIKNYWRTRIQKHLKQADQTAMNSGQSSTYTNSDHHHHNNHHYQLSSSQIPSGSTSEAAYNPNPFDPYLLSPSISYPETTNDMNYAPPPPPNQAIQPGTSENFWGVDEDIWSMQLFCGD